MLAHGLVDWILQLFPVESTVKAVIRKNMCIGGFLKITGAHLCEIVLQD